MNVRGLSTRIAISNVVIGAAFLVNPRFPDSSLKKAGDKLPLSYDYSLAELIRAP